MSGEVPVAEMSRLLDSLENSRGVLRYALRGNLDNRGSPLLEVSIVGSCQLRCQRCLGSLEYPITLRSRLMLCDQATLDALDDEEDESDSILADANLDVLALLEDEILLSLPIAPKHELGSCQAVGGENAPKDEANPFAVLAKLKVVK
ncbi:MAG: YceD family protein [Pseudomonadota bacterium]